MMKILYLLSYNPVPPVFSILLTGIGYKGLGLKNKETVLIADNAEIFSESFIELLRNSELANRLNIRTYKLVRKKFSWKVVGLQLQEVYFKIHRKNYRRKPGFNNWII